MRRYDEPIHVRRGQVSPFTGPPGGPPRGPATGPARAMTSCAASPSTADPSDRLAAMPGDPPAQLLWRDRLWVVRQVQEQWLETGPWWDSPAACAVRGEERSGSQLALLEDLLTELEVWRVEAICGRTGQGGVLELTYRSHTGEWRLRGLVD